MKKLFILIILFTLLGCSTEYSTESTEEPTTDQQTYTTIDQLDKFLVNNDITHDLSLQLLNDRAVDYIVILSFIDKEIQDYNDLQEPTSEQTERYEFYLLMQIHYRNLLKRSLAND
jgi:hypothetical protein